MAALRAMAEGGLGAVTIDALAADLGITRGSFYWHFRDREALVVAALEFWEQAATRDVIDGLSRIADPAERLQELLVVAFDEVIDGLEPMLVAHADHPAVQPVLTRVTTRRVDYIAEMYAGIGYPPAVARRRAVLAYATYLGWFGLRRAARGVLPEVAPTGAKGRQMLAYLFDQLSAGPPPA